MTTTGDRSNTAPEREFKLVQTYLDLAGPNTQRAFGFFIAAAIVAVIFGSSVRLGFLANDVPLLRAVAASSNAGLEPLLQLISSSPIAKGCGFMAMVNFSIDWFVWRGHSVWYHVESLVMLVFCAFFVGQITTQLADLQKNRLGATVGIWAAILFAVYPAQCESVCWISARPHLLVMLFYLAALFFYFRFRMLRERHWLPFSIASAIAAFLSEPVAWTLPLMITLAEFTFVGPALHVAKPPRMAIDATSKPMERQGDDKTAMMEQATPETPGSVESTELAHVQGLLAKSSAERPPVSESNIGVMRASVVTFHWVALFFVLSIGVLAQDSVQIFKAMTTPSTLPFLDFSKPAEVFYSLVAPIASPMDQIIGRATIDPLQMTMLALSATALIFATIRILMRQNAIAPYLWLLIWLGLSIIPIANENTHIGQQYFLSQNVYYLAAAPLSILLSLCCIPAGGSLSRKNAAVFLVGGCMVLVAITAGWAWLSMQNEQPWLHAAKAMQSMRRSFDTATQRSEGSRIVVAELPQPIDGITIVPDAYALYAAFAPPLWHTDLTDRLLMAFEPTMAGGTQFIWPGLLQRQQQMEPKSPVLFWNKTNNNYSIYEGNDGGPPLSASFNKLTIRSFQTEPPNSIPQTEVIPPGGT